MSIERFVESDAGRCARLSAVALVVRALVCCDRGQEYQCASEYPRVVVWPDANSSCF